MLGASMQGRAAGELTRVLVADDHVIIRRGMRNLLNDHVRPCEVHEAGSCAELVAELPKRAFHLLMLDLQLGDGSALDLLERIQRDHPALRVLVYSMGAERIYAQRVLRMGCAGYLSKESGEEEVLRAVRTVLQGREYRSHELELRLLRPSGAAQSTTPPDPFTTLSDREVLVMEELLKGTGVKDIAEKLGLQPTTVATYKARLFDKLGASNLLDLKRLVEAHQRREG
jgi:DNA-binding NarL/FixJ family response regulator